MEWKSVTPVAMAPTITKRYSHSAVVHENSMYVFGGCAFSMTTFNDLWRLDLSKRQWVRPLTMGTYPSPKACSTMVCYKDFLGNIMYLFIYEIATFIIYSIIWWMDISSFISFASKLPFI